MPNPNRDGLPGRLERQEILEAGRWWARGDMLERKFSLSFRRKDFAARLEEKESRNVQHLFAESSNAFKQIVRFNHVTQFNGLGQHGHWDSWPRNNSRKFELL